MTEHFEDWLRGRADECRRPPGPGVYLGIPLSADQATAVAELVAAARVLLPCVVFPASADREQAARDARAYAPLAQARDRAEVALAALDEEATRPYGVHDHEE